MRTDLIREFVAKEKRKGELEDELKALKQDLDELSELILPEMVDEGMQSTKIDGRTVYLQRDIFAGAIEGDRAAVVDALQKANLGHLVKENYNDQTLKAYAREIAQEAEESCKVDGRLFDEQAVQGALPEPLRAVLKVCFVHRLRSRKA